MYLSAILGLLALTPPAPVDTVIKKDVLGEGIYLFRAPSDLDLWTSSNVLVIVNDQDVTVFDTNTRPHVNRMVIAEIRKLTDKPVGTLINSHWHMDHWSGNDEYQKAWPGLRIIATAETREFMRRMGPAFFAHSAGNGLPAMRAALDTAIRTGRQRDGTPLTAEARRQREQDIADTERFAAEMRSTPRVLPNLVFRDTLVFWSGRREFRLFSATGDASGSAVLYLPAEKLIATGDVLVRRENDEGPPPWTTNSYAITPWLHSLRSLEALDATIIVPGQGMALRDKAYLGLTAELFEAIITQVHAALERGLVGIDEVVAAVNVDPILRRFPPGGEPTPAYQRLVTTLARKVYSESLDGLGR
jgi:glyoxylase-like metal-dependent hydrolase (beta-lactamase superfamily II)